MFEVGRVCVKLAGRESAKFCVVVDVVDKNFVIIDGNVRRRKCNVRHLEPTPTLVKISKNARTETVHKALTDAGFKIEEKKPPREKKPKPVKKRIIAAIEKGEKAKAKKKAEPKPKPKKKAPAKKKEKPKKKEKKPAKKKETKKEAKKSILSRIRGKEKPKKREPKKPAKKPAKAKK